jgi:hypothetical protein
MRLHGTRKGRNLSTVIKATDLTHVRPIQPLRFPATNPEWDMPESQRHKRMCDLMYDILRRALAPEHSVVSDCFVYFDAGDEKRCLAPDDFVKLKCTHDPTSDRSWRVWEKGAPELAIEILSPSDTKEPLSWPEKMERYHALGVQELVSYDADETPGKRVRAWDRIDGDLVERVVVKESTPCITLTSLRGERVDFVLAPGDEVSLGLRLAREGILLETALEAQEGATKDALAEVDRLRAELEKLKGR